MVGVEWGGRESGPDLARLPYTLRVKVTEREEDGPGDHVLENGLASGVPHIDRVMPDVTR